MYSQFPYIGNETIFSSPKTGQPVNPTKWKAWKSFLYKKQTKTISSKLTFVWAIRNEFTIHIPGVQQIIVQLLDASSFEASNIFKFAAITQHITTIESIKF